MRKKAAATLVACVMIGAVAICAAQTQRRPAGRGFGGGFRRGQFSPPGPPAPVPPEVAMPRPTLEEVAKINAELERFVDTNTSASRDLLKKYASLLVVQVPRDNPCIRPSAGIRVMRHDTFLETAKTGDFDILFYGDSITDLWNVESDPAGNPGGKRVFFMNINDKFLDDKGGLIGFRASDHLHPVEEGYEIWASAVAPTLKNWVK
jgi:hypothetical protein